MVTIISPLDVLAVADKTMATVAMSALDPSCLSRATIIRVFADHLTGKADTLLERPADCVAIAGKIISTHGLPLDDVRQTGFSECAQHVQDSVNDLRDMLARERFSLAAAHMLLPRMRGKEGQFFSRLAVCTERAVLDIETTMRFAQAHGRQVLRAMRFVRSETADFDCETLENIVYRIEQPWPRSFRAARRLLAPAYSR